MINLAQQGLQMSRVIDYAPLYQPIIVTGRTNLMGGGNSFMQGTGASTPSTLGFFPLLATSLGVSTTDNRSVSGRGFWQMMNNIQTASYTGSTTIAISEGGFNDAWRGDTPTGTRNPKTLKKAEAFARMWTCKQILTGANPSGQGSVTRTGGPFVAYNARAQGGVYSSGTIPGNVATYIAPGNTGTWSTGTVTGNQCIIGLIVTDLTSAACSPLDIWVDGAYKETIPADLAWTDGISDGSNAGINIPLWWFVGNLGGSGSHTVEVRKTQSAGYAILDFISSAVDPGNNAVPVMCFARIPYMPAAGYVTQGGGSDVWSDMISDVVRNVVYQHYMRGYRNVRMIRMNAVNGGKYVVGTDTNADNIHPNNTGHGHIKDDYRTILIP